MPTVPLKIAPEQVTGLLRERPARTDELAS